jgi:hypothetical protein
MPFLEGDVRQRLYTGGDQAGQANQASASGVQVSEGDWGSDGLTLGSLQVYSAGFCGFTSDGLLLHAWCWDEAAATASIRPVHSAARWLLAPAPGSDGQFESTAAAPGR